MVSHETENRFCLREQTLTPEGGNQINNAWYSTPKHKFNRFLESERNQRRSSMRIMQFGILRILSLKVIECHIDDDVGKKRRRQREGLLSWWSECDTKKVSCGLISDIADLYLNDFIYLSSLSSSLSCLTMFPSRNNFQSRFQSEGYFLGISSCRGWMRICVVAKSSAKKQYFIVENQLHAVRIKRTHFRTIYTRSLHTRVIESSARFAISLSGSR